MNRYLIFLPVILFSLTLSDSNEEIIFSRIEYLYHLKNKIAGSMWPAFEQRSLSAPLIYFTNTSSYVVNPTEKFIRQFQPVLKYQNKRLRIFKTRSRIDNIPFHMETSMTTGSDTSLYTHNEPFIYKV